MRQDFIAFGTDSGKELSGKEELQAVVLESLRIKETRKLNTCTTTKTQGKQIKASQEYEYGLKLSGFTVKLQR